MQLTSSSWMSRAMSSYDHLATQSQPYGKATTNDFPQAKTDHVDSPYPWILNKFEKKLKIFFGKKMGQTLGSSSEMPLKPLLRRLCARKSTASTIFDPFVI
jgi:hypothetical protein